VKVDAIAPGRRGKRERLEATMHIFNSQEVVLLEHAPWTNVFLNEVCRFPYSTYSDQVDAMTQYLNWQVRTPLRRTTK
jgi:predicted phage terminase large subunit-like protein